MVELQGITKNFGPRRVLADVNLSVAPNEVVVLLGPSGAGKSTLCRVVNRLETVDSGTVLVDGVVLPDGGRELARLRVQVGMVFQSFNLFKHMTILDNLTVAPIRVLHRSAAAAREDALALLDRVHIADHAHKYPAQLSGGQQQRAAIARSLAMGPKVLMFDEPTSALDPEMIKEVVDVMADLAAEGITMIVVTHEIGFARRCADRIVFMADGQIVEEGTPESFLTAPQTQRAYDFLSTILT